MLDYGSDALLVVYKRIEQQYIECTFIETGVNRIKHLEHETLL
jgi:hypothetical protein